MTPEQLKQAVAAVRKIADEIEQCGERMSAVAVAPIVHYKPPVTDANILGFSWIISTLPFDQTAGQQIRDAIERSCGIIR